MTEINVESKTFDLGTKSISTQLNTKWDEKCNFYTTEFQNDFGSGKMACFDLTDGKGLVTVDATFVYDLRFNLNYEDLTSPVKLFFNLGNPLALRVNEKEFAIKKNQFIINVIRNSHNYSIVLRKNSVVKFALLFLNNGNFMDSLICDLKSTSPKIAGLFLKGSRKLNNSSLQMNPQLIEGIGSIFINNMMGMERRLFLEGQFNTILSLMIDRASSHSDKSFDAYNINLLEKAKSILDREFTSPPTIKELAKRVGTNTNKLHALFKEAYGVTINKYVLNKRMELGRSLLLENKEAIGEISQKVGIQNPSYFSKQFKNKFGMLPSEYRENKAT